MKTMKPDSVFGSLVHIFNMNCTSSKQNVSGHFERNFGWTFDDPPTVEVWDIERIDLPYWYDTVKKYKYYCFHVGILYVLVVFTLQKYMQNRQPLNIKKSLFLWNAGLGIFSIVATIRTIPALFYVLQNEDGFYTSICLKKGINRNQLFWGLLFCISKVVELGDTVFLILRKRPVVLLQWYHHLVTMIVTWTVSLYLEPIGRWYVALNFGVHSLMYPYFALKTIGVNVPVKIAYVITVLQFLQMLAGLFVNLASLRMKAIGYECARENVSILAFSIVYGSFAALFGKLLYDILLIRKSRKKEN